MNKPQMLCNIFISQRQVWPNTYLNDYISASTFYFHYHNSSFRICSLLIELSCSHIQQDYSCILTSRYFCEANTMLPQTLVFNPLSPSFFQVDSISITPSSHLPLPTNTTPGIYPFSAKQSLGRTRRKFHSLLNNPSGILPPSWCLVLKGRPQ